MGARGSTGSLALCLLPLSSRHGEADEVCVRSSARGRLHSSRPDGARRRRPSDGSGALPPASGGISLRRLRSVMCAGLGFALTPALVGDLEVFFY
ncbi:hypothetical protein J5N97_020771 [Dioscorea zingiberensis]|uniref:Uncharacterized protein n=1 Tax=Dioscorea zingiberensis TaxID=325984 RepID=A0A9D5HE37_9LILI|nr:hypothetical protein J5N97_020771 [Dioscorea zingiberensis]